MLKQHFTLTVSLHCRLWSAFSATVYNKIEICCPISIFFAFGTVMGAFHSLWKKKVRIISKYIEVRVVQYTRTVRTVGIVNSLGGPVSPAEHTQAVTERARAGGVRGLRTLTIWPLGGWFPHWLPLFLANNRDLIWEEISKGPVTPLLCSDRFLSLAFEEMSLSRVALWRGFGF